MRLARNTGLALTIGGFLLIGYGLYDVAGGRIYQAWRGRELDRVLDSLPPQPAATRQTVSYEPGSAIGRLEIPRIGLSVVVLEGSDTGTLRLGVGRLRNSGMPGDPGNVVLAGHRDTFFRSLREIRPGDQISLRTPQGTFPYTVDWTTVVNPHDTSVLAQTASPALTLVTCYPFYYLGSAPQRFIVRALPVGAADTVAARRPSPFAPLSAPVTRQAVARADGPPVITTAAAVAPPIANTSVATASIDLAPVAPAPIANAPVANIPVPNAPIANAEVADNPPVAPDPPAQPKKGPLKRAFQKIGGIFSGGRAKLQ